MWSGFVFVCAFVSLTFAFDYNSTRDHICNGSNAQNSLALDKILGKWYAVEIVHHRDDGKHPKGTISVDSCPILNLTKSGSSIRLHWQEKAGEVEYNFIVNNPMKPGYWISTGGQNGSMLQMQYTHFAGSVEVTKAVGSHMVLTFCTPGSELYSLVMSRQPRLPHIDLEGVNKMLEIRGLLKHSVKEACRDSGNLHSSSALLILILYLLFQ